MRKKIEITWTWKNEKYWTSFFNFQNLIQNFPPNESTRDWTGCNKSQHPKVNSLFLFLNSISWFNKIFRKSSGYVGLNWAFVWASFHFEKSVDSPVVIERISHKPVRYASSIINSPADNSDGMHVNIRTFHMLINS